MARRLNKLTALAVEKKKEPGRYADGGGLYLQIGPSGSKSWLYRYTVDGQAREMGLGSLNAVSLSDARTKAADCRKARDRGLDPILARKADQAAARLSAAKSISFKECAEAYVDAHQATWRNAKHADQWRTTLRTYAEPTFGDLPVQDIDLTLVLKVLEPIWNAKPETATRLRGRIEAVLNWATVRGYRQGDNPARWRGHLDKVLPARGKVRAVKHHPALPYDEIGTFLDSLRAQDGIAARALEFLILTAARTNEVTGARWREFDLAEKVWTVPASRIKAKREHRVPLSPRAQAIVSALKHDDQEDQGFVFEGARSGKPLSNVSLLAVLKRMKRTDITAHGFRSTFRDWAAERTSFPREVAEMALAHAIGNKVEAAYRRGDLFNKRRRMMDAWAAQCEARKSHGEVVPIGSKAQRAQT